MRRSLIALVCCLLLAVVSYATNEDGRGTIIGKVLTSDGHPADAVTVILKGTKRGTLTDERGKFILRNINEGDQELEISLTGYETITKNITVSNNQTLSITIELAVSKKQLEEIVITAGKNKFSKTSSETVAKIPLKNLENPQVYNSVTKELLQSQVVVTYADALKNVPGVVMQLENNNAGGTITMRGFSTQSFFRNGLPGVVGAGTMELANVEILEAIKGPSGTLYGAPLISFGGLFDRITKKPFNNFKTEIAYTAGGFGLSRLTADVNTPLNKERTVLMRVNAVKYNEGSFQDAGFKSYVFVAPVITWKADDKTTFTIEGEYRKENANGFYRLFADGSYATGVRSPKELKMDFKKRFSGDDIATMNAMANVYLQLERRLSDKWTSKTNYTYLTSNYNGLTGYLSMKAGNDSLTRNMNYTEYSNNFVTDIQQNFNGDFKIGRMRNRLLIGFDYYNPITKSSAPGTLAFDVISVSKPGAAYTQLNKLAVMDKFRSMAVTKSIARQNIYSAYVQDVLNITDQLIVLAGLRVDRFENPGTKDITKDTTTGKYGQTAFSPKLGLVYQLIENRLSIFGNYLNGFQNNAIRQQPDGSFSSFKPSKANQWEAGIKANLLGNKLTGTLSYYDIKVADILRADAPARPTYIIQNGVQYSRGVEVDMTAVVFNGFNILAGYAYNNSRIEKSTPATDGFRPISAGPETTINFWLNYTATGKLKGLGVGFGGNYASKNKVILDANSYYALPAYTVLGASASYDQLHYRLSFKVDNMTNQKYWVGWSTTIPQMPCRFSGSVAFKF